MQGTAAISVANLGVTFAVGKNTVRALSGVSFDVQEGESFGIVGESGSGKSTILRVLAGLVNFQDGTVTVRGRGRRSGSPIGRAGEVQMVFQDPYASLHPRHTVDRALREPLMVNGRNAVDARIERVLDEVGLGSHFRYRYPNQLSGGQRQRVAIARAIILEPPILLLDEPTSALDVSVQAEILNLLRHMRGKHAMTFVLVSHNLGVVANLCDRLAVMRAGEIVEIADVDRLRARALTQDYSRELLAATFDFDRGRFSDRASPSL